MIKKCEYCGKEFKTYCRRSKYCSRDCRNKSMEKREFRICKNCGKKFEVRPSDRKIFCSIECYRRWNRGGNQPQYKKRLEKICLICGEKFYVQPHAVNQIYCSKKCADIGKKKIIGEGHPLFKKIRIRCDNCGREYFEKPAKIKSYKHHFCSRRCLGIYQILHQSNPSNIEKRLADYLIENKISFICQFRYEKGIADFFIKPNLIVEVDGDYWHNLPKVKIRDKKQTKFLESKGYKVLRLWEHEIKNNIDGCLNKVKLEIEK